MWGEGTFRDRPGLISSTACVCEMLTGGGLDVPVRGMRARLACRGLRGRWGEDGGHTEKLKNSLMGQGVAFFARWTCQKLSSD